MLLYTCDQQRQVLEALFPLLRKEKEHDIQASVYIHAKNPDVDIWIGVDYTYSRRIFFFSSSQWIDLV